MDETQVKHFIMIDNGVPDYEISNFLEISIKHVEDVLSDY